MNNINSLVWVSFTDYNENEFSAGGYNADYEMKSTEVYNIEDQTFSPFPIDLPIVTYYHNLIKVDETHFYLCCGDYMDISNYMLDLETGVWTDLHVTGHPHERSFAGKSI